MTTMMPTIRTGITVNNTMIAVTPLLKLGEYPDIDGGEGFSSQFSLMGTSSVVERNEIIVSYTS